VHLLIEELPADLVLPGQLGDRFSPGEHLDGQPLPLLRRQLLSRTRNRNSCRSWPVKRSRSRSGITLRDRDRQSSLTIHVCFLHETQFVRTNDANMEEAGILEKITCSGFCYPALNQVADRTSPVIGGSIFLKRRVRPENGGNRLDEPQVRPRTSPTTQEWGRKAAQSAQIRSL